jgi:DNA invertase Pin-like site-specific DNA recombinase
MICGYARVSTDWQTVGAQVGALTAASAAKMFRETASGTQTDRAQLRKALAQLNAGDVLIVTKLDRLPIHPRPVEHPRHDRRPQGRLPIARDAWADTTTPHGRLMLTVLGGLATTSTTARFRG